MGDHRRQQLTAWLQGLYDDPALDLSVVSADASFRRYFRFKREQQSFIAVDAPPDKEDCSRFQQLSEALLNCGVNVPKVLALNLELGFMVLNDFGDQLLMPIAQNSPLVFNRLSDIPERLHNASKAEVEQQPGFSLYQKMLQPLFGVMKLEKTESGALSAYDADKLLMEMQLMEDWFFPNYLEYTLSQSELALVQQTQQQLLTLALQQPQVGVHRDYHSRNLMILPDESVGVIDFQDAVVGPLTYDLVSLLRDCYLVFPNSAVSAFIEYFYQQAQNKGVVATNISLAEFTRWFDWMGLQRHIKVLGIFARLAYRDGKFDYLDDIPRVFDYVIEVSGRYAELESFQQWMLHTVKPLLLEKSKAKSNG